MADLRALCADLGWSAVRTYIQSGNLVFDAPGEGPDLAGALEAALGARYPFPIPVLLRSGDQWRTLALDRPFAGWTDPKKLSVCVLGRAPEPALWQALEPWKSGEDEIELVDDRLWLKTPGGQANTKYTNTWLEKKLGVRSTARNRATVDAILGLLEEDPPTVDVRVPLN